MTMNDISRDRTIELAARYLRYPNVNDEIYADLIGYYEEVAENTDFRVISRIFPYMPVKSLEGETYEIAGANLEISGSDFAFYMRGCDRIMLIAATLSSSSERMLRRAQYDDMAGAAIMDAIMSAYLEVCRDLYVEELGLGVHTFCFSPGYGDIDISINKGIVKILEADKKIGLSVSEGGLFIPQKSTAGFIGIGDDNVTRTCKGCVRFDGCELRKEKTTCYSV